VSDPVRLKVCDACRTAIPEGASTCPECGARQPMEVPGGGPTFGGIPPGVAFEDLFTRVQGAVGDRGRAMEGMFARALLRRYGGCLFLTLLVVFGGAFLLGLLAQEPLHALAWLLVVMGAAGLLLTGWLIRLLRATPPRQ
jgi:hypothetical protein